MELWVWEGLRGSGGGGVQEWAWGIQEGVYSK